MPKRQARTGPSRYADGFIVMAVGFNGEKTPVVPFPLSSSTRGGSFKNGFLKKETSGITPFQYLYSQRFSA